MAQKTETVDPNVPADETSRRVTTAADLGFDVPQVVVDDVVETANAGPDQRTVIIRVNENIDQMSVVDKFGRREYTFEAGHRYRVPLDVAMELEAIGKIWH